MDISPRGTKTVPQTMLRLRIIILRFLTLSFLLVVPVAAFAQPTSDTMSPEEQEDMQKRIQAAHNVCPADMSLIFGGGFLKGWDNGEPDERPEHVKFTNTYCMDQHEYPNKAGEIPMDNVSFDEAQLLCQEQGKRLCHEMEWERACRGMRGTIYAPTQNYQDLSKLGCNLNSPAPTPSGGCLNEFSLFDMTGNLWEWVDDPYSEDNPWPLIKGGSYKKGALFASCYARFTQPPDAQSEAVGFRCCADSNSDALQILTGGQYSIYEEDMTCPGLYAQRQLLKQAYRAMREPDATSIYHFDNARAVTDQEQAQSSLLVIKSSTAELRSFKIINGEIQSQVKQIDLSNAVDALNKIHKYVKETGKVSYDGCFGCGSQCHYLAKNFSAFFDQTDFDGTPIMTSYTYMTTDAASPFDIEDFLDQ